MTTSYLDIYSCRPLRRKRLRGGESKPLARAQRCLDRREPSDMPASTLTLSHAFQPYSGRSLRVRGCSMLL